MTKETPLLDQWLGRVWYIIFLLGFNAYIDTLGLVFLVGLIWLLFEAIDYFFSKSKMSLVAKIVKVLVKIVIILFFMYRSVYGTFFNPVWIYYLVEQVVYDAQYYFSGPLRSVQAMPVVFNLIIFIIFKGLLITDKVNSRVTLFATLGGGSLLMLLSLWQDLTFSLITLLFIVFGIIKMVFDHMEESNLKPNIYDFMFTVRLVICISIAVILIWTYSIPVGLDVSTGMDPKISGYNSNDSLLGGPIEFSDTPTFSMRSDQPMYLRGESRYLYTGKGWASDEVNRVSVHIDSIPMNEYPSVEYEESKISIEVLSGNYPVIFSGLGTTSIDISKINWLTLANDNDLLISSGIQSGDSYDIVIQKPIYYDEEALRIDGDYPSDFPINLYTYIPNAFPYSVRYLAEEITEQYTNHYDKAVAIKDYLTSREFKYSLDVSYPPRGMDFVEHFLEEKEGYCEHYSTAFVMMARSVGVPARWVKGFTSGARVAEDIYVISDRNAHAWAEIYLPEAGWVMFEATQGFQSRQSNTGDITIPRVPVDPVDVIEDPDIEIPIEEPSEPTGGDHGITDKNPRETIILSLIIAGFALMAMGAYIFFKKSERKLTPQEKVISLYNRVLDKFRKVGLGRKTGETPREYSIRLSPVKKMPTDALSNLTDVFESVHYGSNSLEDEEYKQLKKKQKKYPVIRLTFLKIKNVIWRKRKK